MAIINTVKCEICGELKKEVNGWLGLNAIVANGQTAVHIFHATDDLEFINAQNHLCGLDHAAKRMMQILAAERGAGDGK
jgi:hypothetical protein